jgi:pimeloyl-ACP methyl ester carboxylesterase
MADVHQEHVILIPGLNCTKALFGPQVAALGGLWPMSIADHGGASSLEAIAGQILAAAPERFAMAGLSMGGYIAFEIMRQAPQRVTRLCLLDTRAVMDTREDAERRRRTIALATSGQFEKLHGILWPRLVHPSRRNDQDLEAVVLAMMRDTGPERFVRQQTAVLNRRDYQPVLQAMRLPVTIIVGAQDEITPPSASREMAGLILGARMFEVADCGHLSTLEAPAAVAARLEDWLKS